MATQSVQIRPALRTDLDCIARVQARTMVAAPYYDRAIDERQELQRLRPGVWAWIAPGFPRT